jgi:hypothetical protein
MKRIVLCVLAAALAVALVGAAGCRRVRLEDTPSGRPVSVSTETTQVALGEATALKASLRMGVGELNLSAGEASSATALDATFRYAPADWKPEVTYSVAGTEGALYVSQPEHVGGPNFGKSENTWALKLAPDVPTNLSLKLGVGASDVDLRGIDVTELEALTGVGEATIDLAGERTHDLTARVEAGIGAVTISVPTNVGVRIVGGQDGLGDLSAEGFSEDGNDLVNAAWSGTGPKIDILLTRGIGEVKVVSVD